MTRFRFRLDRVLTLREQAERSKAHDMGAARRRAAEQDDRTTAANDRLERTGRPEPGETDTSAGVLHLRNRMREVAHEALRLEAEEQRAAEAKARHAEAIYHEARRDRRMLERLRDQQAEEHELETARDEQKEIDEITLQRRGGAGGAT